MLALVPALVLASTLAGCSDLPDLSAEEEKACADLMEALPDPLAGTALSDADDRTATWGEVELTCGVPEPEAYDEYAPCLDVRGVGWFVPDEELEDLGGDATATALTTRPYVSLHVPAEARSAGVDTMLTELAGPLKATLETGEPCH